MTRWQLWVSLSALSFIWSLVLGTWSLASAQDLEEVVAGLEGTYQEISGLRAEFKQASFNKSLNQTIAAEGTVSLKKPGKMRWDFKSPTPQQLVSDGKRFWIYTPELKQVQVAEAPSALTGPAGSFLMGLGKIREEFHVRFLNPVAKADQDGLFVLDLTPKRPEPTVARLVLAVDPKEFLVRKATVYDSLGNSVTLRFTKISVNPGLADSLFVFKAPPGVAVIPMMPVPKLP